MLGLMIKITIIFKKLWVKEPLYLGKIEIFFFFFFKLRKIEILK